MGGVITRFAPSPTGPLHVGGARTALFNYLFTRQHQGQIYLRIEDTDRERSKLEFEANILDSLSWLGLNFDNPEPIRQSARGEFYHQQLEILLKNGTAYLSSEKNEEGETRELVRFKNPNVEITFQDLIRGNISFQTQELGDFVIAKGLDEPLYHFAVVADDAELGVSHVIRGDDHIANTPRQILIQRALGAPQPHYAHLPLILAPDRTKLSKRRGAVSVLEYRDQGYLPGALLNFLALLGWHPQNDQEVFDLQGLITAFDLTRVQKGGAVFNQTKLDWLNGEHLRQLTDHEFVSLAKKFVPPQTDLAKILQLTRERVNTFGELRMLFEAGEFTYFFEKPQYDKVLLGETVAELAILKQKLEILANDQFTVEKLRAIIMPYADERGRRAVLWPWRVALSGRERSADPFTISAMLGKSETLNRIDEALAK